MKRPSRGGRSWAVGELNLHLHAKTLALCRLERGRRTWLDNGVAGASLWQLHVADRRGYRVDLESRHARQVAARTEGRRLCLEWSDVTESSAGAGPFDVLVTVEPTDAGRALTAWRVSVKNRSKHWTLWHVVFPRLAGLRPGRHPETDRVFWPEVWGRQTTGWSSMQNVSGPCGGYGKHSAQFMGFTRDGATLYLAAQDPGQWPKLMTFDLRDVEGDGPLGELHFLAYPTGMTEPGNSYDQPYDIVAGELAGDWYDAARVYGAWVRRQPWVCEPPVAARRPAEEREILVWEQASINTFPADRVITVNGRPAAQWLEAMRTLRRRLGVRMAVHFYHWHRTAFDTNYPEYFPAKRGFRDLVARLQEADIIAMPYLNARLWDLNAPSYDAEAERHAVKACAERVRPRLRLAWPESYGNGQLLAAMCLSTPFWRRTIVDLCRRITRDLGCRGVYLDQLGCSGSRTCVDPRHGHTLGGGDYWLAGCRRLLAEVRHAIGPEPILTTENNWEACVADFDALLDTSWNHENNIPLFPAVYWGHGVIYGGDVFAPAFSAGGEDFVQRMGMRAVWGGVLGWGHFEHLLAKENRRLAEYFESLISMRLRHARFFRRGRFLRPPQVRTMEGNLCASPLKGPVLAGCWSDPDDQRRAAIFLVNVTRRAQKVTIHRTDSDGRAARRDPLGPVRIAPWGTAVVPAES